jgi:ribosomal protein L37AE/L43A
MIYLNQCPCCSEQLLRHTRQGHIYWFCSRCWQEMPNFSVTDFSQTVISNQSKHGLGYKRGEG